MRRRTTVHPRSRGEHTSQTTSTAANPGSSPLARGTLVQRVQRRLRPGFIPARAGNTPRTRPTAPASPVHPRSRGEHHVVPDDLDLDDGSSPLARGTPWRSLSITGLLRFIPARAGNTSPACRVWRPASVHPRSRGEHLKDQRLVDLPHGSSPLARGTRRLEDPIPRIERFIPARAGNTRSRSPPSPPRPVHPRSRGEHATSAAVTPPSTGSSPLARGTHEHSVAGLAPLRFIPARAGNTCRRQSMSRSGPVHPRSRGEHDPVAPGPGHEGGSSPLARGTQRMATGHRPPGRFIPARAGNTRVSAALCAFRPVHPRSRGEHCSATSSGRSADGSSPLARGTRPGAAPCARASRFIPARAGNTAGAPPAQRGPPVHPRSRGEHVAMTSRLSRTCGSSPLARGTRDPDRRLRRGHRFIPARAGNTARPRPRPGRQAVHPRSRGEHPPGTRISITLSGSSPLARGTRAAPRAGARGIGFIPARAGNTPSLSPPGPRSPVHPRSRGEHEDSHHHHPVQGGSSPLARGTPARSLRSPRSRRFIPARAGNT